MLAASAFVCLTFIALALAWSRDDGDT